MRIVALALVGCGLCWAQPAEECKPSTLNIPGAQYPCVYPDHRAAFRLVAPEAQKVQVKVGKTFDMTKGADGAWTVTTTPLVVGFHYYSLVLDGVTVADPATRTFSVPAGKTAASKFPRAARPIITFPKMYPTAR